MSSISSLFRYKPQNTVLHNLDPRVKLLWFFSVIFPATAWSDPIYLGGLVLLVFFYGWLAKDDLKDMLKAIVVPFPAYIMILLFNLFAFDFTTKSMVPWDLLYLGWLMPKIGSFGPFAHVSVESLVFTLGICTRVAIFILASRLFITFSSPSDITTGLNKFKVPMEITTAISVAFGYLPELARQVTSIMEAQRSRGWRTGYKNPIKAVKNFIPVVMPIVSRSMVRSEMLATAMASRGLGATRTPITIREIRFARKDAMVTVVLLGFLGMGILLGTWCYNIANFRFATFILRNLFFGY